MNLLLYEWGVIRINANDIRDIESEAAVIMTLIRSPSFILHSENLLPNHFTDVQNSYVYLAIQKLVHKNIEVIDSFNIITILNSDESTITFADALTVEGLNELIDMSDALARKTLEEYKMSVSNVREAAFRRRTLEVLKRCETLCFQKTDGDLSQKLYKNLDEVLLEYSTVQEIPPYKDIVDGCWEEIKKRQGMGCAGIPFKFKSLNEYVTLERGELVVFCGEAKQGKSMMLLNCAVDLLRQALSVLYLDSELTTRLFTGRLLAHLTGIPYKKITSGGYSEAESQLITEAINWLKSCRFTHIYLPFFDQETIYTTIKKVSHTQGGLDAIIVDYFKGSNDNTAWDSYAGLGNLVNTVKNQICGDMGVIGIGAAQLNHQGKIADSARIARNASTIITILDKSQNEIEADGVECGNKKLSVILNRNGMQMAPGEYIDIHFDGNLCSYEEARQHIPQTPY